MALPISQLIDAGAYNSYPDVNSSNCDFVCSLVITAMITDVSAISFKLIFSKVCISTSVLYKHLNVKYVLLYVVNVKVFPF